ncbi:AfsR/SARP family transcriptional regulator [Streptomyces sp. NPDC050610]|uniref:AfsR/SARP family transcriptional regulator n=1 Tax=Streptomyces sp. NPDC050610 TaxID=3157097 RepID=UPI003428F840
MASHIHFSVLGTLRMTVNGTVHVPRGPKVNKLLALLLLRAGQVVETGTLVDELWAEQPPRGAVSTVRTHIYHLRRQLAECLGAPVGPLLATRPPGYLTQLGPDQLDATLFTRLTAEGRALLARGLPAEAAAACRAGLRLWEGRALSGVHAGQHLEVHLQRLDELRVQAVGTRVEAEMRLGMHAELIPELRSLVAAYPYHERFHACLIEALRLSGRRREALDAYDDLRRVLTDELGLGPSAHPHALLRSILTDTPPGTGAGAGTEAKAGSGAYAGPAPGRTPALVGAPATGAQTPMPIPPPTGSTVPVM